MGRILFILRVYLIFYMYICRNTIPKFHPCICYTTPHRRNYTNTIPGKEADRQKNRPVCAHYLPSMNDHCCCQMMSNNGNIQQSRRGDIQQFPYRLVQGWWFTDMRWYFETTSNHIRAIYEPQTVWKNIQYEKSYVATTEPYEKPYKEPQGRLFPTPRLALPRAHDAEAIKLKRKGRTSDGFGAQLCLGRPKLCSSYSHPQGSSTGGLTLTSKHESR